MQTTVNSTATEATDHVAVERRARRMWVTIIVGLLGSQILIGAASVYLSVGDPTVAVVPDYYQSAVNWDVTRRARELTQDLGWSVSPAVSLPMDGGRVIKIELKGASGKPVTGVNMTGEVYHHARGAERKTVRFSELSDGVYTANTSLVRSGLWQIKLRMEGLHGIAEHDQEFIVE